MSSSFIIIFDGENLFTVISSKICLQFHCISAEKKVQFLFAYSISGLQTRSKISFLVTF